MVDVYGKLIGIIYRHPMDPMGLLTCKKLSKVTCRKMLTPMRRKLRKASEFLGRPKTKP